MGTGFHASPKKNCTDFGVGLGDFESIWDIRVMNKEKFTYLTNVCIM
jgi:hypothetical protein